MHVNEPGAGSLRKPFIQARTASLQFDLSCAGALQNKNDGDLYADHMLWRKCNVISMF